MSNLPKDIWLNPEGYKMAFDEFLTYKEGTLGDIQYTDKAKADAEKLTLSTTIECLDKTRLHLDKRIEELERLLFRIDYVYDNALQDYSDTPLAKEIKQALEEK